MRKNFAKGAEVAFGKGYEGVVFRRVGCV
jgi:hypothetical protein